QSNGQVNLPVNNFVRFTWRTVVPTAAHGPQAISVERPGAGMMALDVGDATSTGGSIAGNDKARTGGRASGFISAATTTNAPMPTTDLRTAAPGNAGSASNPVPNHTDTSGQPSQTVRVEHSAFDNFRSAISTFEPIYFDFGDKGGANARFQLSFKYRLFTPEDPRKPGFLDNLYFGYTQTSLWDLHDNSVPFVDTTYNPSLFWHKQKLWQTTDQRWFTGLATGVEHKSNGKGGDDSRSLNDVFVQPELNHRFNNGSTLTFAPRVKAYFLDDQNADYASYLGRVDWKLRWAQDNGLVLDALYQQGHHGHHAVQLEAAWPLQRTFLHMNGYLHVQFYQGYGETLLGYNVKADPQVRIGLSLVP
ncbi:MAG TPA: phospholipase A, partial [Burkholderiaceae bacterium]|nr:phospholipase A [Burkholderiaceae bacterium]